MPDLIPRSDDAFDHFIKTAYYAARWVNSKGEPGPWSAITGSIVS